MITSAFISTLRRQYQDLPDMRYDKIQGNGLITLYRTSKYPIKEGTFRLYNSGALLDTSGYTLDLDTGDIQLGAPTSDEITARYQSVKWRDQNWLESIQSAIQSLGDKFYRVELRDGSSMSISAGVQVMNCPSSCIRLTEALESSSYTSAGPFTQMGTNIRYDRRANKLLLGGVPSRANYMQISYMKRITQPTSTGATLDVEDNWLRMLNLKCGADFARSMATKISLQGNATVEEGHLSMAQLRQLANDNEIMFENLKRTNKPVMPSMKIPFYIHGGGDV